MSKGFASNYRIVLLSAGLLLCFAGLGVRLVCLHVVDREELLSTIVKVRHRIDVEKARRGDILDARGAFLATSRPLIVVGVDPSSLVETPKEKQKWPQLAELLGLRYAELEKIFTTKFPPAAPATPAPAASTTATGGSLVFDFNRTAPAAAPGGADESDVEATPDGQGRRRIRWVKLAESVSEATMAEIDRLAIRGVYQQKPPPYRRVYPNKQLAAHLIGYVDREERPAAGIEYYTDFYLRGQNGWRVGERDGRNRELAQFRTREVSRSDGYSVKLSIDSTVQDIVEQELAHIAKQFRPKKASIIVSDPRTGFILGLANYPTFDLNEYNKLAPEDHGRMRNVAVADIYEPGSVFKIVAAAAVIEEGLVTRNMTFDCSLERILSRGIMVEMPDEDHRIHNAQALTLAEIVAHSSNKGAAILALKVGEERFDRYVRAFGFGRELGFPIGGEEAGLFKPANKRYPIDITRIAMGHSVSATVLQMHQAMSVIANDGVLLQPQIISKILTPTGELVFDYGRVELGRVVSEQTARAVAEMLTGVVSAKGTAPRAEIPGYDVAGKTGTTQKLVEVILPDGRKKQVYSNQHHIASFVGFFPAGAPQVAISVIVDEAQVDTASGTAYGGLVAAPSFKSIGEKLIPIRDIKPVSLPTARLLGFATTIEGGRR